jgi:hypothetical protein
MEIERQKTTTVVQADAPTHNAYGKKKAIFKTYQIIWYILGVVETLLALRIGLKALGANMGSGFVDFIYSVSAPFALPFSGIFGVTVSQGNVVEWSTFVAMAVYALIAYGIVQLILLIKPTNPVEVSETIDNQ